MKRAFGFVFLFILAFLCIFISTDIASKYTSFATQVSEQSAEPGPTSSVDQSATPTETPTASPTGEPKITPSENPTASGEPVVIVVGKQSAEPGPTSSVDQSATPTETPTPLATGEPMETATPTPTDTFVPVVRFAVTTDIHVYSSGDERFARFTKSLEIARDINEDNYPGVDAFIICGDVGESGKQTQLQTVKDRILEKLSLNRTQVLLTMGNHDYYNGIYTGATTEILEEKRTQFETVFEDFLVTNNDNVELIESNGPQNSHYLIKGYHFIMVSVDGDGWNYGEMQSSWLKNQLEIAENDTGKEKPIYLFRHIGSSNTVLGTDNYFADGGVTSLDAVLKDYPQVVDFSGHSHCPVNNECSILQSDHTYIGTGTGIYSNSVSLNGTRLDFVDENKFNVFQFLIVEIDEFDRTRIRIFDVIKNDYVGDEILLEGYTKESFKYTENYFVDQNIYFEEESKIDVVNITNHEIEFCFDVVSKNSFTATYYKIVVKNVETGGKDIVKYVSWSYFNENYDNKLYFKVGGLYNCCLYSITIYGCNSLYSREIGENDKISTNSLILNFATKK